MAASKNSTISRRTVLGASVALLAPVVPAVASQEVAADRKLLQLCRNYERLERAYERACVAKDKVEQKDWAKERQRKSKEKPLPPRPAELTGDFDVWPDAYGPFGRVSLDGEKARQTLGEVADGSYSTFAFFLKGRERNDSSPVYPPEASRAKARELLAIYDDWQARAAVSSRSASAAVRHWSERRLPCIGSQAFRRQSRPPSPRRQRTPCAASRRSSPPLPQTLTSNSGATDTEPTTRPSRQFSKAL